MNVPLAEFAQALRSGVPHPHVHLLFADARHGNQRLLYVSELQCLLDKQTDKLVEVQFMYVWAPGSMTVIYAPPGHLHVPIAQAWHPEQGRLVVPLGPPVPASA